MVFIKGTITEAEMEAEHLLELEAIRRLQAEVSDCLGEASLSDGGDGNSVGEKLQVRHDGALKL